MRFPYLNSTQEEGVNKVLRAKDVAIVHGPPGTGKTTTLVELSMRRCGGRVRCLCAPKAIWLWIGFQRN